MGTFVYVHACVCIWVSKRHKSKDGERKEGRDRIERQIDGEEEGTEDGGEKEGEGGVGRERERGR